MSADAASPDWANPACYAALIHADRSIWAWTFGSRGIVPVRSRRRCLVRKLGPSLTLIEQSADRSLPGLRFAGPVRCRGDDLPAVLWDYRVDPSVLPVTAVPASRHDHGAFDLRRIRASVLIVRGPDRSEYILITDGPMRLRLAVLSGTLLAGPVRLSWHLPGPRHARSGAHALRRLMAVRRGGHLPPSLARSEPKSARLLMALRAGDARRAGNSQRDIACLLFGEERVRDDWNGRSDYLRMRIQRLLCQSHRLSEGGYRSLLR